MDKQQPWGFVALHEYAVPSAPLAEVAHKGLKKLWCRIWPGKGRALDPSRKVTQASSSEFFRELFAPPDWDAAAPRLAEIVDEGFARGATVQVFLGGPHRCTPDLLRQHAAARKWRVIEAPTLREILERTFEPAKLGTDSVVVIPQLAHWFIRHDDGLDVIRDLLDWVLKTRQPVVVGCHSWAWRYLDKAVQVGSALPDPRVLAPLTAEALEAWFRQLAREIGKETIVFREAPSGKSVLEIDGSRSAAPEKSRKNDSSNLLVHIASQGRGLPEITWSLWRECVLRFKQDMLTKAALGVVTDREERTIWVPSWAQLRLPDLPSKAGHLHLFLMHNLLLHAGLPEGILPLVMPFTPGQIHRGLRELQARGMVEQDEDRWRVAASAYPSVRNTLNDESYLVDAL